jgi:hypothetical protein
LPAKLGSTPCKVVHCGLESQRGNLADAWNAHEAPADDIRGATLNPG